MMIEQVNQKSMIFVTIVFLNKGFTFQSYVCNRCYDLVMMSMNLSNIDVSNNKGAHYRCIIGEISKSEALILTQNIDLINNKKDCCKT